MWSVVTSGFQLVFQVFELPLKNEFLFDDGQQSMLYVVGETVETATTTSVSV